MIIFTRVVLTALICTGFAFSQSESPEHIVINPPGLHISPFKAHLEEPRVGVFKFLDAAQMKVDVGNSIDVLAYEIPASALKFTVGIDFMAYAFTTGAQGLRLQIDAIDGFFGGNLSCSKIFGVESVEGRLRFLHHSAHFVDGHYDTSTHSWIDDKEPFPYTRDYGELVTAYCARPGNSSFRLYGGFSYATLVRPSDYERWGFLGGAEIAHSVGTLAGERIHLYCAYNISLDGVPAYAATHQIQLGCKLGDFYGKGPSLYFAFYTGTHMFREYAGERLSTIGAGFTVDFF